MSGKDAVQIQFRWLVTAVVTPIFVAVIGFAVLWGGVQERVAACEANDDKQDVRIEAINTANNEIKVTLAEIQRDIAYIRLQIEEQE